MRHLVGSLGIKKKLAMSVINIHCAIFITDTDMDTDTYKDMENGMDKDKNTETDMDTDMNTGGHRLGIGIPCKISIPYGV